MRTAGVTNLRLKYPGEPELLFRDFSLSIASGEKVLLLGPSGCGKSTLLQVLTGLVPHAVEMPMKADEVTVPSSWGYVFQDPDTQFCMPFVDEELAFVLENVRTPRERMVPLMRDVLERVGLRFDELHTEIGMLSQGMKQRLAIASVLALQAETLFLDEPTALLDPEGTHQVWETLKAVAADKTVIIVEHKIGEIVSFVDRIVVLNDRGELVADGPRDEVFAERRAELREYGVWYPGVWDEYAAGERYLRLRTGEGGHSDRLHTDGVSASSDNRPAAEPSPTRLPLAQVEQPLLRLCDFRGYRGRAEKIAFPEGAVRPEEWICVVGKNGAGKSTLMLALMKLIRTTGEYTVRGRVPASAAQLSEDIAFIFQNPEFQFVADTVEDEAGYSLRLAGRRQADDILADVSRQLALFGLSGLERRHPYQLSLGQKRRLSVAAAIINGQPVVLLDEPTFGQDAVNTFAMLEQLERLRQDGAAIIMVTHDEEIVRYFATRVWQVADGRVAFDGPPRIWRDLMNRPAASAAGPTSGSYAAASAGAVSHGREARP